VGQALLNVMSDVVVELDEELRLPTHSPQLAGLLLFGSKSLDGMSFTQLLASDEDREHFKAVLAKEQQTEYPIAGMFHTRILDSCSNVLDIEIFHVKKPWRNSHRHLLGVREHSNFDAPRAAKLDSRNSQFHANNEEMGLMACAVEIPTGRQVEVTFEAFDFNISGVDDAFIDLFGKYAKKSRFDEWFGQGSQFILDYYNEAYEGLNQLARSGDIQQELMTGSDVYVTVPISKTTRVSFSAKCTVSIEIDALSDDNQVIAKAIFYELKHQGLTCCGISNDGSRSSGSSDLIGVIRKQLNDQRHENKLKMKARLGDKYTSGRSNMAGKSGKAKDFENISVISDRKTITISL